MSISNFSSASSSPPTPIQRPSTPEIFEAREKEHLHLENNEDRIDTSCVGLSPPSLHGQKRKRRKTTQLLIDMGEDASRPGSEENSILRCALKVGDKDLVRLLLQIGTDYATISVPEHNSPISKEKRLLLKLIAEEKLILSPSFVAAKNPSDGATWLHAAVRANAVRAARLLVGQGANIDTRDASGNCSIDLALKSNQTKFIKLFLNQDTSFINRRKRNGKTPLMIAAAHLNVSVLKILLDRRADPTLKDRNGWTSLHYAVHSNYHFIDGGADKMERIGPEDRDLDAQKCVELLTRDVSQLNVRTTDELKATPLMLAVSSKFQKTTQFLLIKGADPTLRDKRGKNSFHHALTTSLMSSATLRLFLSKAPELVKIKEKSSQLAPLHLALAKRCEPQIVALLIERRANLDALDLKGRNAFHSFLNKGYLKNRDLANLILFKDKTLLNKTTQNKYRFSPIHLVALNFQYDKYDLEFLLRMGGDFSSCDQQGWNLLHWMMNDWEIYLKNRNKLLSLKDVEDRDSKELLSKFLDKLEVILRKQPRFLNQQDNEGKTPLERAPHGVASFLKERGIEIKALKTQSIRFVR